MLVLAAFAAALLAAPASAKTCAERVIDDWADLKSPGIDRTYPIHCYREAIAALPEDAATYSSASDDIRRALLEQTRAHPGSSTGDGSDGDGTTTDGEETTPGSTAGGAPGDGGGGSTPSASGEGAAGEGLDGGTSDGEGTAAAGEGAAAAPSSDAFATDLGDGGGSLPLPVIIVIAALGVAAAVAAGTIVIRRLPRSGGESPGAPSESSRN